MKTDLNARGSRLRALIAAPAAMLCLLTILTTASCALHSPRSGTSAAPRRLLAAVGVPGAARGYRPSRGAGRQPQGSYTCGHR